jgi:hypothetical protein
MSTETKHLWEFDHPYYAAEGYPTEFESFAELKADAEALDEDMNFIYRFDWKDWSQPHFDDLFLDGDDRSKEELCVHFILQRKSKFMNWSCPITKDQEPEVIEWLQSARCAGHLRTVWAPILGEAS